MKCPDCGHEWTSEGGGDKLSEQQRKMIYGIGFGIAGDDNFDTVKGIIDEVAEGIGVSGYVKTLSRADASKLIDALDARKNGCTDATPQGNASNDDDLPF